MRSARYNVVLVSHEIREQNLGTVERHLGLFAVLRSQPRRYFETAIERIALYDLYNPSALEYISFVPHACVLAISLHFPWHLWGLQTLQLLIRFMQDSVQRVFLYSCKITTRSLREQSCSLKMLHAPSRASGSQFSFRCLLCVAALRVTYNYGSPCSCSLPYTW